MKLLLHTLTYLCVTSGVVCVHSMTWLPCQFVDEKVSMNAEGHWDTTHVHRDAMLQFGQTGDAPLNPHAITFLVTKSKLDVRRYMDEAEADDLECEVHRYSTEGIHVRWPTQPTQEYNNWFTCSIKHKKSLFSLTAVLRLPTDDPAPGQHDYRRWTVIHDREILATTVALVVKTKSPSVRTTLSSQEKLHCQFAVDHKAPNATVEWHSHVRGERLFRHSSARTEGAGVDVRGLAGGDASYHIPHTKMSSEGKYICSVTVNPLLIKLNILLHIEESPRVSISVGPTLVLTEGEEHRINCVAEKYYPLDVEITWSQQDPATSGQRVGAPMPKVLDNVLLSSHKHNQDRTYTVTAFFYLQAALRDSGKQFTCSVSHRSLRLPIKKSFILAVEEPSNLPFVLTVSVLVSLLLLVLWRMLSFLHSARRKSVQKKPY